MVGQVFLAHQTMCNNCPYRNMDIFLKVKHCDVCKKKKEFDKTYRVIKYR